MQEVTPERADQLKLTPDLIRRINLVLYDRYGYGHQKKAAEVTGHDWNTIHRLLRYPDVMRDLVVLATEGEEAFQTEDEA